MSVCTSAADNRTRHHNHHQREFPWHSPIRATPAVPISFTAAYYTVIWDTVEVLSRGLWTEIRHWLEYGKQPSRGGLGAWGTAREKPHTWS